MSDERIIEVIAESLSPVLFHDAIPTVKRRLRMRASGILFDLRAAGFDVYRPQGCPLVTEGDGIDELRERVARALHDSDPVSSPRTREDWDIHRAWYYSQADAVLRVVAEHLGGRDV